jgi:cytochrome c biogenesis protein CcmG/thiol:disulfide interchange protein DsbE
VGSAPPRPIVFAIAIAVAVTLGVIGFVAVTRPPDTSPIARGEAAPDITGTTLEGAPFRLADLRGRPVIINFWGPTCVPCRDEFPLLKAKLEEHADDGLTVVGILMLDSPDLARTFIDEQGASWPTVDDPDAAIRGAYRVALRPQTYFVDRDGILRSIQVGEVRDTDFERQYALISGGG